MRKTQFISYLYLAVLMLNLTGCRRSADDIWDDTRTAGRHMGRGLRSLGGKHGDSRQVFCREDFVASRDNEYCLEDFQAMEFEPLPDQDYTDQIDMLPQQQVASEKPKHVPGIEGFTDPKTDADLAQLFRHVRYPYNSSLIKGKENLEALHAIASYLKDHQNVFVFIEGHCDERGAEAYNLALGSRRSNAVRNFLVKEGVSPENVFTVSYGKERPLDLGHSEKAWEKNRRAEFKIYQS